MNPVRFVQISLILVSATFAVIFLMAWRTMGRHRYTLIWAFAFLVIVVQEALNTLQASIQPFALYWAIVCSLSVLSVILGAWGHFLRAGFPLDVRYLFLVGGSVVAVVLFFTAVRPHVGLRMSLYVYHNALLLALVAVVIYRFRPKPLAAEIGASASYALLAAFQFAAATFALLQGRELNDFLRGVYLFLNFVTLPAAFTAMGLFTVFILASDLSDEMKQLAMTDVLTRCLNRRGFYDQAQQRIASLLNESRHVCLIYWDIDRFKSINDRYGHAGGDQVLIEIVQRVRNQIKKEDLLGRIGGEEFVILVGRVESDGAYDVAERLRKKIEADAVFFEGEMIQVTASFGVVLVDNDRFDLEGAIDAADAALYRAKGFGRNQVVTAE